MFSPVILSLISLIQPSRKHVYPILPSQSKHPVSSVSAAVPAPLFSVPSSYPLCSYFWALFCAVLSVHEQLCHRRSSWALKCSFCCSSCSRSKAVVDASELSSVINCLSHYIAAGIHCRPRTVLDHGKRHSLVSRKAVCLLHSVLLYVAPVSPGVS